MVALAWRRAPDNDGSTIESTIIARPSTTRSSMRVNAAAERSRVAMRESYLTRGGGGGKVGSANGPTQRSVNMNHRSRFGLVIALLASSSFAEGGGSGSCGRISCGTSHQSSNGTCCTACNSSFCVWSSTGGSCAAAISTGGPVTVDCLWTTLVEGQCVEPFLGTCSGTASSSMTCILECDPEGGEGGN